MKNPYIILWADYASTGLFDGATWRLLRKAEMGISEDLWQQIQEWVESYAAIIPMDVPTRVANLPEIKRLDYRGLELVQLLHTAFGKDICVRYKSEGMYSFIENMTCFDRFAKLLQELGNDDRLGIIKFSAKHALNVLRLKTKDHAISDDLWRRIARWVDAYRPIWAMDVNVRLNNLPKIKALDREGLALADDVRNVLLEEYIVIYKSTGLCVEMNNIDIFDTLAYTLKDRAIDISFGLG